MYRLNSFRLFCAALVLPFVLASCFSSTPTKSEGQGEGEGTGQTSSSVPAPPMPPTQSTKNEQGSEGQSTTSGRTARNSSASAPESGNTPTNESRDGSTSSDNRNSDGGRLPGKEGGSDGAADIRVATAERPGAGANVPEAPVDDTGRPGGTSSDQPEQVGVAEALEAANQAVDAAAEAVDNADATIARAKEEAASDAQGAGQVDSFDPWASPGSGEKTSDAKAGGGGSPNSAKGDGTDTAAPGGGADATAGEQEQTATRGGQRAGEDNFDPFADYGEQAGGPGQPNAMPNAGSLQIADDAVAAARAALNRARRALIEAGSAGQPGSSDADADAVQLAAAKAAMDAAAEAVVAAAIAVMAASNTISPEPGVEPDYEAGEEALADSIEMIVAVMHRDMQTAGEALEATADLLGAASALIAMIGSGEDDQQYAEEGEMSAGERVASLEEQLDTSLTIFDDRMHAEGSGAVPTLAGDEPGMSGAAGGNIDPDLDSDGSPAQSGSGRSADNNKGDRPINRRDGKWSDKKQTAEGYKPDASGTKMDDFRMEDPGAAQDDDIVARQLREAAAAETDPELREKLWEEYRNYKEGLEGGGD